MENINWNTTKRDTNTIAAIAKRGVALAKKYGIYGIYRDYNTLSMDLTAVHLNDVPLRLSDLRKADDANFGHDVFGIVRYIDRKTGKLTDCFLPRFAQPERAS